MERALQGMLIAGKSAKVDVLCGDLKATIRKGYRDYTPGPVLIGCHILRWAQLFHIITVRHMKFKELIPYEIEVAGYDNEKEALAVLQKFYPGFTREDEITFIEWEPYKG